LSSFLNASFLALFDGLLPEVATVSVGLTAVDDPLIFIPSFDELSPTSAQIDSFEVFTNCHVATLLPNIVTRFP
jgi:hypothetical protein